ncbi:hypothetical protein ACJ73_05010 [Blastomyces percursus]|uniref:CCHC-type domain-containing protein n=1 Tax=Blastomyces percursus TaxID=1658174 RepID=A0A1J9Q572_9EURO|nr:hypothetical protein ACJ73_05010 [Blastomyces percursus]
MYTRVTTQPKAQKPTRKRKKTDSLTAVQLNGTPNIEFTGNSDGRPNKLDEIPWLVTELKGIIAQQGQAVETLKTCCEELKADHKELIRQNSSLKDEITALRAQVTHKPDQRSWASIASNSGANGESSTPPPAPTPASTKVDRKDPPLCVRISAAQASDPMDYGGSLTRYLPVEEVKARVTDALQKNMPTKGVETIGIGTTKTGYIIRFRDKTSKDTASVNEGWGGSGTWETKQSWLDPDLKITEENELAQKGYKVEEIAWLKKRESTLGASASLGIWLDSAEAAELAVNNGMVFGHRYIGSIEAYQIKKKRCYRCLAFGHLAWNCKERLRCGFCTREHNTTNCRRESTPKCADCAERHPTGAT